MTSQHSPPPGDPLALRSHLERLYAGVDAPTRLARDPVRFAHRHPDPRDAELAGLIAACLAYGRVTAFGPVLEDLFGRLDAAGGPRRAVERFDPVRDGAPILPLIYRWNRGIDLVLLFAGLSRALRDHDRVEGLFVGDGAREALDAGIGALRAHVLAVADRCGVAAERWEDLPRGLRTLLPSPSDGSACKRWNMYLRWMVRPSTEGIDLGLWTTLAPRDLVIPVDTHVLRIAGLIGLTDRTDGSWRTAEAITAALRRIDPEDPIRFDFALAHLGISGACRGRRDPAICPSCPLDPVCAAPTGPAPADRRGPRRGSRRS